MHLIEVLLVICDKIEVRSAMLLRRAHQWAPIAVEGSSFGVLRVADRSPLPLVPLLRRGED